MPRRVVNSRFRVLMSQQILMAVMSGAFGLAGYYFGNTPSNLNTRCERQLTSPNRQKPHICDLGEQSYRRCWQHAMAGRGRRFATTLQVPVSSRRKLKERTKGCSQRIKQRHRAKCQFTVGKFCYPRRK
jgi:hypothetical protein